MPDRPDTGDTDRLHLAEASADEAAADAREDTADLSDAFEDEAAAAASADELAERYSEGIIRFYRARTILSRGADSDVCDLAWSYLKPLEPHHLPPVARPAFFALAYFMYGQAMHDDLDHEEFSAHVLDIAGIIDRYLDDIEPREGG